MNFKFSFNVFFTCCVTNLLQIILKIGQYLPTMWTKVCGLAFGATL